MAADPPQRGHLHADGLRDDADRAAADELCGGVLVVRALVKRLLREEHGNTLVIVAAFLPVVIGLMALVTDVGNGFTHKRHLQTQADAGVLAAGSEFAKCASGTTAGNTAIESVARDSALTQTPQVGGPAAKARVSAAVNATGYGAADDSLGKPCDTGFIDLNLTDKDVPPFVA